jgi:hypothetical protein
MRKLAVTGDPVQLMLVTGTGFIAARWCCWGVRQLQGNRFGQVESGPIIQALQVLHLSPQ